MPPIRFLASARYTKLVAVILLFSEIMPSCSYCKDKKLVYITIVAFFSRQPSFYIKYTKLNMRLSYNIRLVPDAEYLYLIYLYSLQSL